MINEKDIDKIKIHDFYQGVLIGKPDNFSFVRGTSIQDALFTLVNGFMNLEIGQRYMPSTFNVYASADHTTKRKYGKEFAAESNEIILQQAKEDALERGRNDFLYNRYVDEMNAKMYIDFVGEEEALQGDQYRTNFAPKNSFEYILNHADKLKGVLFYFDNSLYNHKLEKSLNGVKRRNYNQVEVRPKGEITRNNLLAVEPLGDIEKGHLDEIVKYYQ